MKVNWFSPGDVFGKTLKIHRYFERIVVGAAELAGSADLSGPGRGGGPDPGPGGDQQQQQQV